MTPKAEGVDGLRPVKVVHCADMHLDASFARSGISPQAAKVRAEELKATFARVVDLVRDEQADLFLIAGDLFEGDTVRRSTVQSVMDLIASEIPHTPVFIAPGNHDPLRRDSYYGSLAWPANVTVFGPQWQWCDLAGLGVTVHGWGYDRVRVSDRHLANLRIPASEQVQIVLLHGSAEGYPSEEGVYLPLSREECLTCGADYVALGHFHAYQVVAERNGPLAQYPGAPEGLSFGMTGPHGVLVGTVSKAGNAFRLVPVGQREHVTREVNVNGAQTLEAAIARIDAAIPPAQRHGHLFRITLTGEVDPDLDLDPELLQERLGTHFHSVDIRNRTTPALDFKALAAEQTLRGRFVQRLLAEVDGASPEEQEELYLALRYGLEALEGGR